MLAAFSERSLAEIERNHIADHLSCCSECRQILELAIPERELDAQSSLGPDLRGGWRGLRWGLATAATAALIFAGFIMYHQEKPHELGSTSGQHAEVARGGPDQLPIAQTFRRPTAPLPDRRDKTEAMRETGTPAHSGRPRPGAGKGADVSAAARTSGEFSGDGAAGFSTFSSDQLAQNEMQQLQPDNNVEVVKAKPVVPQSRTFAAAPASSSHTSPGLPDQAAHSAIWAVSYNGTLQRSFDAGRSWQPVRLRSNDAKQSEPVFATVTAFGSEVWAGGSAAVLFHSLDAGTTWQQVLPSAQVVPSGDITGVVFSGPQNGRFVTSAGETWTTSDGGQNWQKEK